MFVYGGCDGNNNRFNSYDDCQAGCNGKMEPTTAQTEQSLLLKEFKGARPWFGYLEEFRLTR